MMPTSVSGDDLLKKAHRIGQYYGFEPLAALTAETRLKGARREPRPANANLVLPANDAPAQAVSSFLVHYRNADAIRPERAPVFIWHTNVTPGRGAPKRAVVQFHALGTERALAETVIIRAALALVRDLYHAEPVLRVNSMGDRETRARYLRELATFFRRRGSTLPSECLAKAQTDAFAAAELVIARECAESLPASTEYLSDASRKRFEDLLEYLESTETRYELARDLLSRGGAWNDTCFEVSVDNRRVAWGSRYNELAKQVFGQPMVAMGVTVFAEMAGEDAMVTRVPTPRLRFVFLHIGDEAKRSAFNLLEDFKKAHLPLTQSIGIESLTEQMRLAERSDPFYLLIMGRKEALERTVILRDRHTQEELILPINNLAERLKQILAN